MASFVPDETLTRLASALRGSPLRARIVGLVAEGKSRKMIAQEIGRSTHAIDAHLKAIYRATAIHDRVVLAVAMATLVERQSAARSDVSAITGAVERRRRQVAPPPVDLQAGAKRMRFLTPTVPATATLMAALLVPAEFTVSSQERVVVQAHELCAQSAPGGGCATRPDTYCGSKVNKYSYGD